jgi:hypothetical protein
VTFAVDVVEPDALVAVSV